MKPPPFPVLSAGPTVTPIAGRNQSPFQTPSRNAGTVREIHRWIMVLILLTNFVCILGAETVVCARKVEGFDPADPTRLIGAFEPQTSLEIEEFVPSAKMYRVLFKAPNGTKIRALCRPEDCGKTLPPAHEGGDVTKPKTETKEVASQDKSSSTERPSLDSAEFSVFTSLTQLDPALWEMTSKDFALKQAQHSGLKRARYGFQWVSAENTENNVLRCGKEAKETFLEQPLYEVLVQFKNDKPREIMLLLFNRGDAGKDLEESEFQDLMKKTEGILDDWLKSKGVDDQVPENAIVNTKRKSWVKAPLRVDLEWNVTWNAKPQGMANHGKMHNVKKGLRVEFVRLVVSPCDGSQSVAALIKQDHSSSNKPVTANRVNIKERIKRDANGDVYLTGVPMVDQGGKGYCAVAVAERLMRYYGLDIDQNELAKTANTRTRGGTSVYDAVEAIKKTSNHSLIIHECKDFDRKEFLQEMRSYNEIARQEKKELVEIPSHGPINVERAYSKIDGDLLRRVRLKKAADKARFIKDIMDSIDNGTPAFWSVMVGLVKEAELLPQIRGGHARLIIGYNKETSEIIYTDSWGKGHEFKRMLMDDAYVITHELLSVSPSG